MPTTSSCSAVWSTSCTLDRRLRDIPARLVAESSSSAATSPQSDCRLGAYLDSAEHFHGTSLVQLAGAAVTLPPTNTSPKTLFISWYVGIHHQNILMADKLKSYSRQIFRLFEFFDNNDVCFGAELPIMRANPTCSAHCRNVLHCSLPTTLSVATASLFRELRGRGNSRGAAGGERILWVYCSASRRRRLARAVILDPVWWLACLQDVGRRGTTVQWAC